MENHQESFAFSKAIMVYGLENPMASGMTTVIFDKGEKIEAVTVDAIKIAYMEAANLPGFKVLLSDGDSWLYEMDKLENLSENQNRENIVKINSLRLGECDFSEGSDAFLKIAELFGESTANGLSSVYRRFKRKNIHFDIHSEQFLKDKKGKIHCVDAVMDKKIYKEILATN